MKIIREFLVNLSRELKPIWDCKFLVVMPIIYTLTLLGFTTLLRTYAPVLFMDNLKQQAEVFGDTVFSFVANLHTLIIGFSLTVVGIQMSNVFTAIRKKDWELFQTYFGQRVFAPLKYFVFILSLIMAYCIANCDYASFKNNLISQGMVLFVIILAWVIVYEMDNPMSKIWKLRKRIPEEWNKKLDNEIRLYEQQFQL